MNKVLEDYLKTIKHPPVRMEEVSALYLPFAVKDMLSGSSTAGTGFGS